MFYDCVYGEKWLSRLNGKTVDVRNESGQGSFYRFNVKLRASKRYRKNFRYEWETAFCDNGLIRVCQIYLDENDDVILVSQNAEGREERYYVREVEKYDGQICLSVYFIEN